jgi:hypothetical protein
VELWIWTLSKAKGSTIRTNAVSENCLCEAQISLFPSQALKYRLYKDMKIEHQIILAIFGSGILSTFIAVLSDWVKRWVDTVSNETASLYKTREEIHKEFLKNIDFIYKADYLTEEEKLKKRHNFLKTYRSLFLYASDNEVKSVNGMLDSIVDYELNEPKEMQEKKDKIGNGFIVLRKHVLPKTKLTSKDFRHLS